MKKLFKKYGVLALGTVMAACAMQGCYIDGENCHKEVMYQTQCDGSSCYNIRNEYNVCPGDRYYNGYECRYDWDCSSWSSCIDGYCVSVSSSNYSKYGYVQACGFCTHSDQCAGLDSACTLLASGEQVCTTACRDTINSSDCPGGYRCMTYGEYGNTVTQCLPINNSCDINYCDRDSQCSENGVCSNHRCVAVYNKGDNCQYNDCKRIVGPEFEYCYVGDSGYSYCTIGCYHDYDCGMNSGYACALTSSYNAMDSGVCVVTQDAYCTYSNECPSGLTCVGGRCTISCNSDLDCVNSAGYADFYCAGGYCRMASYQQYYSWE